MRHPMVSTSLRSPSPVLDRAPDEDFDTKGCQSFPSKPSTQGCNGAMEEGGVARTRRIASIGRPVPSNSVDRGWQSDMPDAPPKVDVLEGRKGSNSALDVLRPGTIMETISRRAQLSVPLGNHGEDHWRDLCNTLSLDPVVRTKPVYGHAQAPKWWRHGRSRKHRCCGGFEGDSRGEMGQSFATKAIEREAPHQLAGHQGRRAQWSFTPYNSWSDRL